MNDTSVTKPIVVGLGEVLWDVFADRKMLGGAPANFACHAASVGCETFMVSAVGADPLGNEAIEHLDDRGLDTNFVSRIPSSPTGRVEVEIDELGQPRYDIIDGVAWDHIPWRRELDFLAQSCHAVCFGTLAQRSDESRNTINKFLNATGPGCLRVFDVNLRTEYFDDSVIVESLCKANVLKLNLEELPIVCRAACVDFSGDRADEAWMQELASLYSLKLVMLTKGATGSTLFADGEVSTFNQTADINVINTVGAGDAFAATAVSCFLRGWPLYRINFAANKIAAFVCSQLGATPRLPKKLLSTIQG